MSYLMDDLYEYTMEKTAGKRLDNFRNNIRDAIYNLPGADGMPRGGSLYGPTPDAAPLAAMVEKTKDATPLLDNIPAAKGGHPKLKKIGIGAGLVGTGLVAKSVYDRYKRRKREEQEDVY